MFSSADRRARAAAKWLARMGNESAAFDREAFERWRAHPDNARAFNEAARTWALYLPVWATTYARGASTGLADGLEDTQRAHRSRRIGFMATAGVLVAALAGIGFERAGMFDGSVPGLPMQVANRISTKAKEVRAFRLSDGSIATLGGESELAIAYTRDARRLTLLRGNARFEVAHDVDRPFEVRAGRGVITAHGTLFDVRIEPQGVKVVLLRGAIDVERLDGTRRTGDIRKLAPGDTLTVPVAGPLGAAAPAVQVDADKSAMMTFDNIPLNEAVEAFNRRSATKIVIDANAGNEAITGGFNAGDPDSFAQLIASMFDLALTHSANGDLLLSAKR